MVTQKNIEFRISNPEFRKYIIIFFALCSKLIALSSSLFALSSLLIALSPKLIAQRSLLIAHRSKFTLSVVEGLIAQRSLLIAQRSLLIAHRSLLIAHRSLLIAHRSLLIAHRSLLTALCSLLFAFSSPLLAQGVHVSARVDSNNILIGDWLKLHVELEYPSDTKISYPAILDSLEGMELIERPQPAITKSENKIIEKTVLTISAYDTGTFVIPALDFGYILKNDTTLNFASTQPIPIFVHGVGVDHAQEIKDIKPPLSVPITFAEILPYLIGFITVLLLGFILYYIIKKRQQKDIWKIFSEPRRPPYEIAIDALRSLEAEKLWQRGEVKLYHSKLTDIIRTYIEDRFNIKAMESTTDEILADYSQLSEFNGQLQSLLKEMLTLADFVKFAKRQPLPDENDVSIKQAFEFIEKTKPLKKLEEEKV